MEKLLICEGIHDQEFLYQFLKQLWQIDAKTINSGWNLSDRPDKNTVIISCGGLDGIKNWLEMLGRLTSINVFRRVPAKIICDEDPNNQQSQNTKGQIQLLYPNVIQHLGDPIIIEGMLENLVIQYLSKNKQVGDIDLTKSLECMDNYLQCLQANNQIVHPKIKLNLLEYGILLQQTQIRSRKQLDKKEQIIPNIFASMKFSVDIFKFLREELQDFVKDL